MTRVVQPGAPSAATPVAKPRARRKQLRGGGQSLIAQGEPMVWMTGAGLVICVTMIVSLLSLVVYQGITTFWPSPIVQVETIDDATVMGEVTRNESYELNFGVLKTIYGPNRDAVAAILAPKLRDRLVDAIQRDELQSQLEVLDESIQEGVLRAVGLSPQVREAPGAVRGELLGAIELAIGNRNRRGELRDQFQERIAAVVENDPTGAGLLAAWEEMRLARDTWLAAPDLAALQAALAADDKILADVWSVNALDLISYDVTAPMKRRLVRTGNYELTGEHFRWVSDYEIAEDGVSHPEWAIIMERLEGGRFFGFPASFLIDGETVATEPGEAWTQFQDHHAEVRQRWLQQQELATVDIGKISHDREEARLGLKKVEFDHGKDSPQYKEAESLLNTVLEPRFAEETTAVDAKIRTLRDENHKYQIVMRIADGREHQLPVEAVVRAYPANQLSATQKTGVYFSRWWEFLTDIPREANQDGGVFPAIWGTVAMTLLMSVAVVPFGVLAALYLREYAKSGFLVSVVRIAINNLAGVPSIVFGVFGLGFFCYIIGASIDELFFESKLPSPTFGTGGLMWAALTLSLLTLPVVIVATEEALAAVPRSMREGSLACGATKWQTIRRIVLPRAMPGIMTGTILAMARGAGEVAPLMLVGAVKLAQKVPVDWQAPFVHLERSFMHLGFHIYDLGFQSPNSEAAKPMVYTTTLLLIALIAFMNILAIWLRGRLRRKFEHSHF